MTFVDNSFSFGLPAYLCLILSQWKYKKKWKKKEEEEETSFNWQLYIYIRNKMQLN